MNRSTANFLTACISDKSKREKRREELTKLDLSFSIRKGLAEIVAGVIPHKMTRNQCRGILRYGPIRVLKLRREVYRHREVVPKYYLAVCTMAKNEGPYFKEWIEWHHNLGVEKFYIYDNESTDNTKEILAPYVASGLVEYIFWKGVKQQLPIYDDCLDRHRLDTRWMAVIDLDEFIVPIQDKTIPQFLSRFEEASAIEINWLCYGSGGADKKVEGGVMERFKQHAEPDHILNRHVKSIVNPRRVVSFIGAHEVARMSGKTFDSHGQPVRKHFRDRDPQQVVIRINHYAVNSYEEFLGKRARGRSRTLDIRGMDYFERFDLNDIEEE